MTKNSKDHTVYLERLNSILSWAYGLWDEGGVFAASDILDRFSDEAWQELTAGWFEQPEEWQIRLAQSLSHSEARQAVRQLMRMIVRANQEVALCTRESLRAMDLPMVEASIDDQCIREFEFPPTLLEEAATINNIIDHLQERSRYTIRCGEWILKPTD